MDKAELRAAGDLDAPAPPGMSRQQFIGGSDVAAVLGLSRWNNATPLRTYMKKLGLVDLTEKEEDPRREKILRRGKRLEPVIIEMLQDEHPISITKVSTAESKNYHVDAEYPFMACEIDFEFEVTAELIADLAESGIEIEPALIGTIQNGEIKSHHPFAFMGRRGAQPLYGEAGTDEIPIEYGCQSLHGLGVTGRDLTLFVVLVGSDDLLLYCMRRQGNETTIAGIRKKLAAFWTDHVLARTAPAPQNIEDIWAMFRISPESVAVASPEILRLFEEWQEEKAAEKLHAERKAELTFLLCAYMVGYGEAKAPKSKKIGSLHELRAPNAEGAPGELVLSVKLQERGGIDRLKLAKEYPEVAEAVAKESIFYTVTKKGERTS